MPQLQFSLFLQNWVLLLASPTTEWVQNCAEKERARFTLQEVLVHDLQLVQASDGNDIQPSPGGIQRCGMTGVGRGGGRREVASTTHWTNVGLMLGHRRRRWPNIKPALDQRAVFPDEVVRPASPFLHAYYANEDASLSLRPFPLRIPGVRGHLPSLGVVPEFPPRNPALPPADPGCHGNNPEMWMYDPALACAAPCPRISSVEAQATRDIEPMLGQCWADIEDRGQHWPNIGLMSRFSWRDPQPILSNREHRPGVNWQWANTQPPPYASWVLASCRSLWQDGTHLQQSPGVKTISD